MKFPFQSLNEVVKKKGYENNILSVWGEFGVGKTTLSLQIALENLTENEHIYYIYSKPNFPIEKIDNLAKRSNQELLKNIKFIKITSFEDLNVFIYNLESLLLKNSLLKPTFLLIDSITDLYRIELSKDKNKNLILSYKLNFMLATLYYLIKNYKLKILIVNESSHIFQNDVDYEIQSGGKVMEYWISKSLHLKRTESLKKRILSLLDSKKEKVIEVLITLTNEGFLV